ncbi:MAG: hypothetical protein V1674_05040 [Candidatus Omnitrophota bacterium]
MKRKLILEDVYKNLEVKKQVRIMDKTVDVPVKYGTQAIMGLFPISTKKATNFINNTRLKPVEFSFGTSLVSITIFNHIVCPVGPYREIALSIPIIHDTKISVPLIPFLFNKFIKNFGFYSFLLTANTTIGREHAEKIWGYPFYNKNIEVQIEENDSGFSVLAEEKLEKVFSLSVEKTNKEKIIKRDYQTYFLKDDKLINVELNTIGISGYSLDKKSGKLELGFHEISKILQNLSIDLTPLETIYYREAIKIANIPKAL